MKKLISVKSHHIKEGRKGSPLNCPIALALKEQEIFSDPVVGKDEIHLVRGITFVTYRMPRSAKRFIKKFDASKKVNPFNFVLDFHKKCGC